MVVNNIIDVSKLIEHDPLELRSFARLVSTWVYNTIYSYVGNKEDAEELTQDTLIAALGSLDKFRNEAMIKTWVYAIAINKSKDLLKYRTRKKRFGKIISISNRDENMQSYEHTEFMHPGIVLESKEQMKILFSAINQLPEFQKTALILSKLDSKSQKEISEIMNISIKAVESLLSRSKSNLRAYLESEDITHFNTFRK